MEDDRQHSIRQKGQPLTKKNLADVNRTLNNTSSDLHQKETEKFLALFTIEDEGGGKRLANTKDPKDVAIISQRIECNVMTDESVNNGLPKDPKTGCMRLRPSSMPKDFNTHGLLPLSPLTLKNILIVDQSTLNEINLLLPLINLPVYTSKLTLLLTGQAAHIISDSFSTFHLYNAVLKFLGSADFMKSRKKIAAEWLEKCKLSGELPQNELLECIEFIPSEIETCDDAMQECPDDEPKRRILKVKYCKDAPWSKETTREDILEDLTLAKNQLLDGLINTLDNLDQGNYTGEKRWRAIVDILYAFTFVYLNTYEMCIIRLYDESCISGSCIPEKYRGDFRTKKQVPQKGEIPDEMARAILEKRSAITTVRDENLVKARKGQQLESADDAVELCIVPSQGDIFSFENFLNYKADDQTSLIDALESMTSHYNAIQKLAITNYSEALSAPKTNEMKNTNDNMEVE